jgi:hydroxymethylpyrimidine pyrophosphatase-like HAD family hydrolase
MLQAAGRSFAMANAEESVKQAATDVSPWSNVENGVARTLDLLLP